MAARGGIDFTIFGSADEAEKAIIALEQKYERLENKIAAVGRRSKDSSKESEEGSLLQAFAIQQVGNALVNLTSFTEQAIRAEHAYRVEVEQTAFALDESIRRFQVQQGLRGLSGEEAGERATQIAIDAGVRPESVLRVGKQLTSTGFADPLAQGGSAEAIIAFLQSTAQDVDSAPLEDVVSAAAQQLRASNQNLSGENLLQLLVQTRGLFAETPLEAPDLVDFAQARGMATNLGVSQTDFLSAAAIIKEQQNAAQGATGFASFMTRLSAPRGARPRRALEELGLGLEDVDFVGESLPEITALLGERLDALPENRRTPVLAQIFGGEKSQMTAALSLIEAGRRGRFDEFGAMQGDREGFEAGVRTSRGSLAAANRRLEAQLQMETLRYVEAGGITETQAETARQLTSMQTMRNLRGQRNLTRFSPLFEDDAELFNLLDQTFSFEGSRGLSPEGRRAAEGASQAPEFSLDRFGAALEDANALQREANDLQRGNAGRIDRNAQGEGAE